MTFRVTTPLRFSQCDPAGIAYYPRYFELLDWAIEDWTAAVLPVSRVAMHRDHGLGLPTVDLQAKFVAISRFGDSLEIAIDVAEVGRSSVRFDAAVSCAGEARFAVGYTQVLMALDVPRAVPWPDDWRAALEAAL